MERTSSRLTRARRGYFVLVTSRTGSTALSHRLPPGRSLGLLDAAVAVWIVIWIAMGIAVSHEVQGLARLSDTVVTVGSAVDSAGAALEAAGAVPVVGDRLDEPAAAVREAGRSALSSGRSSRDSVNNLSTLLGLVVGLVPTLPVLIAYGGWRIRWQRDRRAVARLLADHGDDPRLPRLLAQRALARLDYPALAAATLDGRGDADGGSTDRLAAAELARLGLELPRRP